MSNPNNDRADSIAYSSVYEVFDMYDIAPGAHISGHEAQRLAGIAAKLAVDRALREMSEQRAQGIMIEKLEVQ